MVVPLADGNLIDSPSDHNGSKSCCPLLRVMLGVMNSLYGSSTPYTEQEQESASTEAVSKQLPLPLLLPGLIVAYGGSVATIICSEYHFLPGMHI